MEKWFQYLNPFHLLKLLSRIADDLASLRLLLEIVYEDKVSLMQERKRRLANPITAKTLAEKQSRAYLDPNWEEEESSNPYNERQLDIADEVDLREAGFTSEEIYEKFMDEEDIEKLEKEDEELEIFTTAKGGR